MKKNNKDTKIFHRPISLYANWRWYMFWLRDMVLNHSEIYKAYKELKDDYIDNNITKEEKINNLIKEAKENTKFYSNIKSNNIKDFPIINKNLIIENYDDICSKKYIDKNLHKMSTSGSTGIPFVIHQDSQKRNRVLAELMFFNKLAGYEFGKKQVFFRIWTEKNRKSKLQLFLQNIVPIDISHLNNDSIEEISKYLQKDKKINNILSYASTMDVISQYLFTEDEALNSFSVKSIITGAERLEDETRKKLKKIFKCNVYSRYSNQENGVLAQEYNDNNEMYINTTNYYIEFLKLDSDEKAKEGELARVVITDLYNYAMPIIRYDTGDTAIYKNVRRNGKMMQVISDVYGRRLDLIYDTNGQVLHPALITVNMWGMDNLKQFKFQQIDNKKYNFVLNIEKANRKDIELNIKKKFGKILGVDAEITFEYVDEIPALASGKRKSVENLMKK